MTLTEKILLSTACLSVFGGVSTLLFGLIFHVNQPGIYLPLGVGMLYGGTILSFLTWVLYKIWFKKEIKKS